MTETLKCVTKYRNEKGKVYGYCLKDSKGNKKNYNAKYLTQCMIDGTMQVSNLTLDDNNEITDKTERRTAMTSNEKHNVRTAATFIRDGVSSETRLILKRLNTGCYEYILVAEISRDRNIRYFVRKSRCNGMFLGTYKLDITSHGVTYDLLQDRKSLPESIIKYVRKFNRTLSNFLTAGEKAFN